MLKLILIFTFLSQLSFAQSSTRAKFNDLKPKKESAVRLSLLLPQFGSELDGQIRRTDLPLSANISDTQGMDTVGLGIGYQYLPYQQLGFIGQVGFYNVNWDAGGDDSELLRLEASAAMALTNKTFMKFGINNARFTSNEDANISSGFGYQLGAGYTIAKNLNLELNYSIMNFEAGIPKNIPNRNLVEGEIDIAIRGFEFGLTGTF
jgi:Outer membrane protein beta-barrel domain